MVSLKKAIEELLAAYQANSEAKQRWSDLIQQGGDEALTARSQYRAAQHALECAVPVFVTAVTEIKQAGELEDEVDKLDADETLAFRRIVAELQLDDVVRMSFVDLVTAWKRALDFKDAALEINDLCRKNGLNELDEMLKARAEVRRESFSLAVQAFRQFLTDFPRQDGQSDESRADDAAWEFLRRCRSKADNLTEDLSVKVRELKANRSFDWEVEELPGDLAQALLDALGNMGLAPEPQLQPQPEAQTRTEVAVLEDEALADDDPEFDQEAKDAVDKLLKDLGLN